MADIKIKINGKEHIVDSSMTILAACKSVGVEIPSLCHDNRLEPFGSCFVCAVKVEGRRNNLVPSCATPVFDGMSVITESDEVRAARKSALELLLSNHYADCIAPCKLKCPSNVDIQGYIALIAAGEINEAVKLIKKVNPLVASCGRVCTRPCEDVCRRNNVDDRVGIDYLKRYASDKNERAVDVYHAQKGKPTGKKIAVVGAGPAGLTAAFYLAQKGHAVKIFEEKDNPGGMIRYGIPSYRLPKGDIDFEVEKITELGAEIEYGKALGRDFLIDDLVKDYDAVFLGIGCQANKPLGIPGEDNTTRFLSGIGYLERCQTDSCMRLFGHVVVLGGGNTAIDCARSALRMGASKVTIAYRRTEKEMPAHEMEIHEAKREGCELMLLVAPKRVVANENNELVGIEFTRMELGEPDASGRRKPVEVKGSEFTLNCDWAFAAVGQEVATTCLEGGDNSCMPMLNKWRTFQVNPETGATNIEKIFAGGDAVTGAATAIEAIAAGKKSAYAINAFLTTGKPKAMPKEFVSKKDFWGTVPTDEFADCKKLEKQTMPEIDPCVRVRDFREVELGFTDEQAIAEAQRCLECGCASVYTCELKRLATQYDANVESYKGDLVKNTPDKRHPFISLDMNKCVLCGRCVRMCSDEIVGANALGFVARGYETKLKPALDRPLLETTCESCGMCAATCPTGAIEAKPFTPKPGPWELDYTTTTCTFCSVGCSLKLGKIGDTLVEVSVPEDSFACFKGRFATRFIADSERIVSPFLNGKKTTLKTATEALMESLAQYRRDKIAVLVSPRLTCEEMNAALHFAQTLGTKLIGSSTQFFSSKEDRSVFSNTTLSDIANAKNIILVQGDIAKTHPTASYHIINAIHRGANLYVIGGEQSKVTRMAKCFIPATQGESTLTLNTLISGNTQTSTRNSLKQSIEELLSKLGSLENVVVVHATQLTKYETPGDTVATHALAEKLGAKLLVLPFANNSFGLEKIIGNGAALCEAIKKDDIDAIIAFGSSCYGEIPALDKRPVLCIAETFTTSLVHRAKVVLPLAAFAETDGTFINAEMRETNVHAAFPSPLGITNFMLIKKLIKKLGGTFDEKIRCDWKIKLLGTSQVAPVQQPITPTLASLSHNYDDSLEGYVFDLKLRSGIRN